MFPVWICVRVFGDRNGKRCHTENHGRVKASGETKLHVAPNLNWNALRIRWKLLSGEQRMGFGCRIFHRFKAYGVFQSALMSIELGFLPNHMKIEQ